MLTKEQVEDPVAALTCADPACHWCVDMRAIAAAYERVTALLASDMPVTEQDCVTAGDWYDRGKAEAYAEVRRALEG